MVAISMRPLAPKVRVRVHTDKPIASGNMLFAQAREASKPPGAFFVRSADQVLEGELILARDDSYRVRLTDRDGLNSSGDTEYFLRVMDDRPPDVRILRPAADQQITPLEEVAIEARAEDDYGMSRFDLVYAVAGGSRRSCRSSACSRHRRRAAGTHTARSRGSGRAAGRRHHLLRTGARRRPRQATDRNAQRHVLPRGEAVRRRVRAGAEPGDVAAWRASRSKP